MYTNGTNWSLLKILKESVNSPKYLQTLTNNNQIWRHQIDLKFEEIKKLIEYDGDADG